MKKSDIRDGYETALRNYHNGYESVPPYDTMYWGIAWAYSNVLRISSEQFDKDTEHKKNRPDPAGCRVHKEGGWNSGS